MNIGLNLYSLRSYLKDESGLLETCRKLKEMGYDCFQFSGMPFDGEMIKRVQDELQAPFVLTHVPIDRILGETDALVREHLLFGCTNIGLGHMKGWEDDEYFCKTASELNAAAGRMKELGSKFFYHLHHYEFTKLPSGKTRFEYLIEECPNINFTFDTYWVQYGGGDVIDYIERLAGRIECIHLKDYKIVRDENGVTAPAYAPLGVGNLNFKRIIEAAKKSGTKYFIVEQDDAFSYPDPFEQVRISADFLKNSEL